MPEIKPEQLLLIAGFILPGAISMYIFGLKEPHREFALKDRIAEAICFSLLNFVVVWPLLESALTVPAVKDRFWLEWLLLVISFVLAPIVWPFLLVPLLDFAERRGWILVRAKTALDDFFARQRAGCWIQVELTDGRVYGGRFDRRSYASSYPDPGHLFIEELWDIDSDGTFGEKKLPGAPGMLLRPADYRLVRVFTGDAMTDHTSKRPINQRGGYRPEVSRPAIPPNMAQDGYRPTVSGPSQPPTQRPPAQQGGDTGEKK